MEVKSNSQFKVEGTPVLFPIPFMWTNKFQNPLKRKKKEKSIQRNSVWIVGRCCCVELIERERKGKRETRGLKSRLLGRVKASKGKTPLKNLKHI